MYLTDIKERISQPIEQGPLTSMTNLCQKTGLNCENNAEDENSTTYLALLIVGNSIWSTYIGSN